MRWPMRLIAVPTILLFAIASQATAQVLWVGDPSDPGGVTAQKPWLSPFWSTGAPPTGGFNQNNQPTGQDARINNGGHVLIDASQTIGTPTPNLFTGTGFVVLGAGTGDSGFLEMTGGMIVTAFDIRIGGNTATAAGTGVFDQLGGVVHMNGGNLNVGQGVVAATGEHAVGTYNLSGGSFTERSGAIVAIGNRGNGTVNQSGGDFYLMGLNNASVNNVVLQLGRLGATATKSSSGTYNLSGGRVVAANTQFGSVTPANSTDGPSINTFSLSGAGLLITDTISVLNNFVNVGDPTKSTVNTFNMTGGTLTAESIGISITNDGGTLAPATLDFTPSGMPENIDDFIANRTQVVGTTTFSGVNSYTQTATGTLAIDLVSQASFDQLVVTSGIADLDGTLALNVHNGFVGNTGDNYQVVVGGTLGTFATVTGNDLGGGLKLNKTTDITGVYLLVALPGDANLDKSADFLDLGILLNNYNDPGGWTSGDFDDSLVVDFVDLGILLNNYNLTMPTATAAAPVPEPSTLVLVACGLLTCVGINLRRIKHRRA